MNIVVSEYNVLYKKKTGMLFSGVSVVITLYNYAHTIIDTLETVCSQDLVGNELIVIDDGSKDEGVELVYEWMENNNSKFYKVSLIQHKKNSGLSIARNTAFEYSEGMYVFVLDADNQIYKSCLRILKDSLEHNREFAFSYSILERFEGDTRLMGTLKWSKDLLAQGNYIDAMSMIRKTEWQSVGGYSVMAGIGWEDYELWLKFADANKRGIWVPQILARYRVHVDSMLNSKTNTNDEQVKLKKQLRDKYGWLAL